MDRHDTDRSERLLVEAVYGLAREVCALREQAKEFCTHQAGHSDNETKLILKRIERTLEISMATQKDQVEVAKAQATLIAEIGKEQATLIERIKTLNEAVGNQTDASPELVEAMGAVSTQLQVLADVVPGTPA